MLASSVSTSFAESRDKSVKIRIISKQGKSREDIRRDLMEMSERELSEVFEDYDFLDPVGHRLAQYVVFQELLKIAVEGSDCLIEDAGRR